MHGDIKKNVRVILVGNLNDSQEQLFKNLDVIRINFTSYAHYAKIMGTLQPDLLIAPLQDTRTAQSKCYNKYVESGVIGATCIYSNSKPYSDVIIEGVNGYLIQNETEDSWYQKISDVLGDVLSLRNVQKTAQKDIMEHHTVDTMIDMFTEKICSIIEGEPVDD